MFLQEQIISNKHTRFMWPIQSTPILIDADVIFLGVSGHYIALN